MDKSLEILHKYLTSHNMRIKSGLATVSYRIEKKGFKDGAPTSELEERSITIEVENLDSGDISMNAVPTPVQDEPEVQSSEAEEAMMQEVIQPIGQTWVGSKTVKAAEEKQQQLEKIEEENEEEVTADEGSESESEYETEEDEEEELPETDISDLPCDFDVAAEVKRQGFHYSLGVPALIEYYKSWCKDKKGMEFCKFLRCRGVPTDTRGQAEWTQFHQEVDKFLEERNLTRKSTHLWNNWFDRCFIYGLSMSEEEHQKLVTVKKKNQKKMEEDMDKETSKGEDSIIGKESDAPSQKIGNSPPVVVPEADKIAALNAILNRTPVQSALPQTPVIPKAKSIEGKKTTKGRRKPYQRLSSDLDRAGIPNTV